jgi:hypothetical protein
VKQLCVRKLILLLAIILVTVVNPAHAQRQKSFRFENLPHYDQKLYHFGFSLGVNRMDFALQPVTNLHNVERSPAGAINIMEFDTLQSVLAQAENGFHIGIVSNLKLAPQWDLRFVPTLTFGDRSLIYSGVRNRNPGTQAIETQKLESTFIDFPLHLKYKSVRMLNTRAYVIGGVKYSYDLASLRDKNDIEEEVIARIDKNDIYYELGVGFDYYFHYFKFSTEIKGSFGIRNMLKPENSMFANSIERLNSRLIMISFMFE